MPILSEDQVCTRCRAREFHFDGNWSLFEYRDSIKELIYQYKFRNEKSLAYLIAMLLNSAGAGHCLWVPVPARQKAKRRRGWDPMELVCRVLKRKYGIRTGVLLRRVGNIPQKRLKYRERVENIQGTIKLRKKNDRTFLDEEIVLLDDIITTGTTLSECARVLKEAGVRKVRALTLAID